MEKHLQLLLKEVNTIIIPGLGALTITNHTTGEIMFMSYLKYDDGKLAHYIAEKENSSEEEAKNTISQKVKTILEALERGDSYYLDGLGSFSKDSSDEICFISGKMEDSTPKEKESVSGNDHLSADAESKSTSETRIVQEEVIPVSIPVDIDVPEEVADLKESASSIIEAEKPKMKGFFSFLKRKKNNTDVSPEIQNEIDDSEIEQVREIVNEEPLSEIIDVEIEDPVLKEKNVESPINNEILTESSIKDQEFSIELEEGLTDEIENISSLEDAIMVEESLIQEEENESLPIVDETESDDQTEDIPESNLVKTKKKRGVGFWVLMLMMVVFVGGGTYIGLNFDKVKQNIPFLSHKEESNKNEKDIIEKLESDKTKPSDVKNSEGEELIETPEEELSTENTSTATEEVTQLSTNSTPKSGGGSFHIILGSFTDKGNAESYVARLNSDGKGSASTQEHDGKFLVSHSSYSNIDDAKSNLSSAKGISANAWILKP